MSNKLFYGDNLSVLRESIASDSVDLIYLDPPFNSNASHNVLFRAPSGEGSQAQIEAFEDTWHWNESAERWAVDSDAKCNTSGRSGSPRKDRIFLPSQPPSAAFRDAKAAPGKVKSSRLKALGLGVGIQGPFAFG
jgi:hypothetical protein